MSILDDWRIAREGASAALLGIPREEASERYVIRRIGPGIVAPVVPTPPNTTADEAALGAVEQQLTGHLPSWLLWTILAGLFVVEAIGCSLLMETLGFENPSRAVFGLMFAALIFLLTYVTARLGTTTAATTVGGVGAGQRRWFVALLATYATLVLAITIVRIAELPDEGEGSRAYDLAAAIIMMCATIGPAWLAEITMRRLVPILPLVRSRSLYRRRIAAAKRTHARAVADATRGQAHAEEWQRGAAQIRATYGTRYDFVRKLIEQVVVGRPIGSPIPTTQTTAVPVLAPTSGAPGNGGVI